MSAQPVPSRLLTLLSLLQARHEWPGEALAAELAVSARTVRRDVDRLRDMGYRIEGVKGPDGGYRLAAGQQLPPLLFDDAQALALAVGLQHASHADEEIADAALLGLATLRRVMPARLRNRMDALLMAAEAGARVQPADAELLASLSIALQSCEVIAFEYAPARIASGRAPAQIRHAEPHHVVVHEGRWHLVGWDISREIWRIYRLDRIRLAPPTGRRFVPRALPGGGLDEFLASNLTGGVQRGAWQCRGEVIVHLSAAEVTQLAHDAFVEQVSADVSRVLVGSWSWTALAAWLLRFDAELEVVGPPELRDAFALLGQRSLRAAQASM